MKLPHDLGILEHRRKEQHIDIEELDFFYGRKYLSELLIRENWQCFYCLKTISEETCELDHVVPLAPVVKSNRHFMQQIEAYVYLFGDFSGLVGRSVRQYSDRLCNRIEHIARYTGIEGSNHRRVGSNFRVNWWRSRCLCSLVHSYKTSRQRIRLWPAVLLACAPLIAYFKLRHYPFVHSPQGRKFA